MIEFLDYDEYDTLYVTTILSWNIHCQTEWWFAYVNENGELICMCKILNADEYLNLRVILEMFNNYQTRSDEQQAYQKIKVCICCDNNEVKNLVKRDYKIMYRE